MVRVAGGVGGCRHCRLSPAFTFMRTVVQVHPSSNMSTYVWPLRQRSPLTPWYQNLWFIRYVPRPDALLRLYCFPWSGAGPAVYKRWALALPEEIELVAVQFPGRAERRDERPATDLLALAIAISRTLVAEPAGRCAFFGHSLGALVAYAVAAVGVVDHDGPEVVIASGSRAPWRPPTSQLHRLPDDELARKVVELGGTSEEKIADKAFQALFLPLVRADLTMCETYLGEPGLPSDVRVSAWAGEQDWYATPESVREWADASVSEGQTRLFPGGHFFVNDLDMVISALVDELGFSVPAAAVTLREAA
jgi:surfactin synthase thioesterase subunit